MPYEVTGFFLLTQIMMLASAFVGPPANLGGRIPVQQKLDALTRFARSGETKDCEAVLATIRAKKSSAEDSLSMQTKSKKSLEAGMDSETKLLATPNLQPETKANLQKNLKRQLEDLKGINFQINEFTSYVQRRHGEERAFQLVCDIIKANRAAQKAP